MGVTGPDRAPVAGRLPPAVDAIDGRVDQLLVGPAFRTNFAGSQTPGEQPGDPVESVLPEVVPLDTDLSLVMGMTAGFRGQQRKVRSLGAGGGFRMNSHCKDQGSLGNRSGRQVQHHGQVRGVKPVVLAGRERQSTDHIAVVFLVGVGEVEHDGPRLCSSSSNAA